MVFSISVRVAIIISTFSVRRLSPGIHGSAQLEMSLLSKHGNGAGVVYKRDLSVSA